jgi:hypothetical protein
MVADGQGGGVAGGGGSDDGWRQRPAPGDVRPALVAYLAGIADWRRQRARELDRDPRSLRTAAGLDELAALVRALPPDDPRLDRLSRLGLRGDVFEPGQQLHYEVGRFRFHHPEVTAEGFLDTMVELAEADMREQGRFGGPQVPGDEPWR